MNALQVEGQFLAMTFTLLVIIFFKHLNFTAFNSIYNFLEFTAVWTGLR